MNLKQKIQELSLDQKAKLYFMGLVRQGKIDRLPEDPKAAYVSMMMNKDDYGRSISGKDKRTFMEPEDSMPAARARKLAGMEDDPRATFTDDEIEDYYLSADLPELATELGYLNEEENYQNFPKPDKINISYTDPGFRFYGMYLHKDGKRFAKISFEDRATKYLKGLGINMEIPRSYNEFTLDEIVGKLKEKGIEADYDAAFDPS